MQLDVVFSDVLSLRLQVIGVVDDLQKLHVRTVPLGMEPSAIAYQVRAFLWRSLHTMCCFFDCFPESKVLLKSDSSCSRKKVWWMDDGISIVQESTSCFLVGAVDMTRGTRLLVFDEKTFDSA